MARVLADRHKRVLAWLAEGRTYEEIARMFNVSVERVKQVEKEAREIADQSR